MLHVLHVLLSGTSTSLFERRLELSRPREFARAASLDARTLGYSRWPRATSEAAQCSEGSRWASEIARVHLPGSRAGC